MKVLASFVLPAVLAVPHAHQHREEEAEIETLANSLSLAELSVSREMPAAQSFSISSVKLAADSLFGIAQQRNQEFQLSLNDTQWLKFEQLFHDA